MNTLSLLDKERLLEVSDHAIFVQSSSNISVRGLNRILNEAQYIDPRDIPPDLVTMNSTVHLLLEGEEIPMEVTLAFPDEANIDEDRISILTPVAQALLGARVGQKVSWMAPRGECRGTITAILHQPEAERLEAQRARK
jgi:regulator of nucleoside diphosphate kinase